MGGISVGGFSAGAAAGVLGVSMGGSDSLVSTGGTVRPGEFSVCGSVVGAGVGRGLLGILAESLEYMGMPEFEGSMNGPGAMMTGLFGTTGM